MGLAWAKCITNFPEQGWPSSGPQPYSPSLAPVPQRRLLGWLVPETFTEAGEAEGLSAHTHEKQASEPSGTAWSSRSTRALCSLPPPSLAEVSVS